MSDSDDDTPSGLGGLWYLLIPATIVLVLAGAYAVFRYQGTPFMMVLG